MGNQQLTDIGGHAVTALGSPTVVASDLGNVVEFKGLASADQLIVDANPLDGTDEFSVEVIFKPAYTTEDPRMIHIQDPDDPQQKRAMIEIRISRTDKWYLDGFMRTDLDGLTLINDTLIHPLDEWAHTAITYKDDIFKTYVNGTEELSGSLGYTSEVSSSTGQTSIGARMNNQNYFAGLIKTLKVTQEALEPASFITNELTAVKKMMVEASSIRLYPNPAIDVIHLDFFSCNDGEAVFRIYDVLGKEHLTLNNTIISGTNHFQIQTNNLNQGLYFLSIVTSNQTKPIAFRVIK